MSCQPVPVHTQERVIRGQLGEPRLGGHTQNNKVCWFNENCLSVSQCSLQRDPEGPSQPRVNPGTQSMSRL
jgi:hypothetical protein